MVSRSGGCFYPCVRDVFARGCSCDCEVALSGEEVVREVEEEVVVVAKEDREAGDRHRVIASGRRRGGGKVVGEVKVSKEERGGEKG